MRSAARPSHSSGTRPRLPPVTRISSTHAAMRARSRPTSVLVPCSTVIGRSVFSRIVRQGTAERRRLLLHAAGVGEHQPRVRHQSQHLEIALRRQAARSAQRRCSERQPEALDVARACADARARSAAAASTTSRRIARSASRKRSRVVDVRWTVQRHHAEAAACVAGSRLSTPCARKRRAGGSTARGRCVQQRIDHHVADEAHALGSDAFAREIARQRCARSCRARRAI